MSSSANLTTELEQCLFQLLDLLSVLSHYFFLLIQSLYLHYQLLELRHKGRWLVMYLDMLLVVHFSHWIVHHVELGDPSCDQVWAAWQVLGFSSQGNVYASCAHSPMPRGPWYAVPMAVVTGMGSWGLMAGSFAGSSTFAWKIDEEANWFSSVLQPRSIEGLEIRVVQSCHLLVCLFIYRHLTAKLAISEYDRWHLFVIYYAYLILTYCWIDSKVDKQKNKWQLWTTLLHENEMGR